MRARIALVTAAALATLMVAAPLSPAQAKTSTKKLTYSVDFVSQGTTLTDLPGEITYGWNHLTGPTTWGKKSASADFLGSVDYVDGSGPFSGFVTFTRSDGTRLAISVTGWATSPPTPGTAKTSFSGSVRVIGGSGAYKGATGAGTMTGYRKSDLGSPVQLTFDLTIRR